MPLPRDVFEKVLYYRREVDRIFNQYVHTGRTEELSTVPAPVDIYEKNDVIIIDVELPGIEPADVRVEASRDVLLVEGARRRPQGSGLKGARFHMAERAFGKIQRMIEVPKAAHMGRLKAEMGAGLLRITIPKVTDRRGGWRQVPISDLNRLEEVTL